MSERNPTSRRVEILLNLIGNKNRLIVKLKPKKKPEKLVWEKEIKDNKVIVTFRRLHGQATVSQAFWEFYLWGGDYCLEKGYTIKQFHELYFDTLKELQKEI